MTDWNKGEQPCHAFKPSEHLDEGPMMTHECPQCRVLVSRYECQECYEEFLDPSYIMEEGVGKHLEEIPCCPACKSTNIREDIKYEYGERALCGNCHSDHHKDGWDSCRENSVLPRETKITRAQIADHIGEINPEARLADGFEEAYIGICERFGQDALAAYDYEKCIRILMDRDGMDEDEAIEYFDFNVIGAWAGEGTPVFITRFSGGK